MAERVLTFDHLSPVDFENLCLAILRGRRDVVTAMAYGRSGQRQYGIDLLATLDSGMVEVWQCKRQATFGAGDLKDVLSVFDAGRYAGSQTVTRLVVAVSGTPTRDTSFCDALAEMHVARRNLGIRLDFVDAGRLTSMLAATPELLDGNFTEEEVVRVLGEHVADQMRTRRRRREHLLELENGFLGATISLFDNWGAAAGLADHDDGSQPRLSTVWIEPRLVRAPSNPQTQTRSEGDDERSRGTSSRSASREWPEPQVGLSLAELGEFASGRSPGSGAAILLEGPVGAGKSVVMAKLAAILAGHRRSSSTPLPVLIHARQLRTADITSALHPVLQSSEALVFLREFGGAFVLLVDGLDEVPPEAVAAANAALDAAARDQRCSAIVASTRPVGSQIRISGANVRYLLDAWSDADVDAYLNAWEPFNRAAALAIRLASEDPACRAMLATPLTAAAICLVAREDTQAIGSRASVLVALTARLFQDWASARGIAVRWHDFAPIFEEMALDWLRGGGEPIPRARLEQFARRCGPHNERLALTSGISAFGLLVRRPEGTYDFAMRSLAEHLAGGALLLAGDDAVVDAASHAWGSEAARHAIALAEQRHGSSRAGELVRRLQSDPFALSPDVDLGALRRLFVAAASAADLTSLPEDVEEALASALFECVANEESIWIPTLAVGVAQEVARSSRSLWKRLGAVLRAALDDDRGHPARWHLALDAHDAEDWLNALFHNDQAVRNVACRKLSQFSDVHYVRYYLCAMLSDQAAEPFHDLPCISAGHTLRGCTRDEHFNNEILPKIRELLARENQTESGAAAIALRPGEAPAPLLVAGLALFGSGYSVPESVVADLAATPDGHEALQAFPALLDRRSAGFDFVRKVTPLEGGATGGRPLSPRARWNAVLAFLPAPKNMPDTVLADITGETGLLNRDTVTATCRAALRDPEIALRLLRSGRALYFEPEAQAALALVVQADKRVFDALVGLWRNAESDRRRTAIPVAAFARVFKAERSVVAPIFAEFLRISESSGLGSPRALWPTECLRDEVVRPHAIARAHQELDAGLTGWDENGKTMRLDGGQVGQFLSQLAGAWFDDPHVQQRVCELLVDRSNRSALGALWAYHDRPASEHFQTAALHRIEDLWDAPHVEQWCYGPSALYWVISQGLARRFASVLRSWSNSAGPLAVPATAALLAVSDDAAQLSAAVAARWPGQWQIPSEKPWVLERLIAAAPGQWADRAIKLASASPIHSAQLALRMGDIAEAGGIGTQ
jgi:hypothetical protein